MLKVDKGKVSDQEMLKSFMPGLDEINAELANFLEEQRQTRIHTKL